MGADPPGDLILRELRAEQVQAITVTDPSPTGLMARWRPSGAHGRVTYYRRHSAGSHLCADDIPAEVIRGAAILHVTGITLALGPGAADAVAHAIDVAREAGRDRQLRPQLPQRPVVARRGGARVRGRGAPSDVVFAGEHEAEIVTATAGPARSRARPRGARPGAGRHQARRATAAWRAWTASTIEQPAPVVTVVDTVGAGDACVAGYLAELMGGAEPAVRLETAVAAGAFAVTVSGDWEGMPDRRSLALLEAGEPVIR